MLKFLKIQNRWSGSRALTLAVLACSLIAGCASAPVAAPETAPQQSEAEFFNAYRLGAGDKLRVIVFDESQLSGEFTVSDSGQVALPLIGNVEATDATIGEFEKRVSDRLRQGYVKEPRVSVQILNYRPFYIYGEVANPGEYPFTVGLHALKAIATAGGYTYRANSKKLFITRGKDGKKVEVKASQDTLIFPGDTIQVPERYF
ncbi:MAG: polysaccharide export protein [Sphingomonadales bacterium]|nr:MAG: polysaccharide export protein [Sphingomonadales bacterium]